MKIGVSIATALLVLVVAVTPDKPDPVAQDNITAVSKDSAEKSITTAKPSPVTTTLAPPTTKKKVAPPTTARPTTTVPPTTKAPPPPTAPPTTQGPFANETVSQTNARQKAGDYLDFSAFSRSGLIKQLEYEGFTNSDATYGTDALKTDWNNQAAKKAADYLDYSSFSRSGLVDQLMYEGFTAAQAEYGVSTTGL